MLTDFTTKFSNRILFALLRMSSGSFWNNITRVKEVQESYLLNLLKDNASTQFGKDNSFKSITSIGDFQKIVPVSQYDDYKYYLELLSAGQKNILTPEPVTKFALSSGSASASKIIPNTRKLLKEFDCCINVWLYDLYCRFPALLNGKAFWIITPSGKGAASSCVKTGFENDSEYFSPLKRWFIKQIFAVPDEVPKLCTGDNYYYMLGIFLLKEKNLRLVSVWNPSVFLILLEKIKLYQKEIIRSIETGTLNFPEVQDESSVKILERMLKPCKGRALELRELLSRKLTDVELWRSVWPNLTLISAWDSAWAAYPAQQLQKLFPFSAFQGKGLLATEACITFPVYRNNDGYRFIPAFTSHFLEFEEEKTKEIKLLHELKEGETYEVIVTTGGGFYRYRLFDLVTCSGYFGQLPMLEFCGKTHIVSDIAGEKLHEMHVQLELDTIFKEMGIVPGVYFLAPLRREENSGYCLYLQTSTTFDIDLLATRLEDGLCRNFHYQHCRNLKQLLPVAVKLLNDAEAKSALNFALADKKLGTIKFSVLRKEQDWDR